MKKPFIFLFFAMLFAAAVLHSQQSSVSGGGGGSGVTVAAGSGITAVTNGSVVIISAVALPTLNDVITNVVTVSANAFTPSLGNASELVLLSSNDGVDPLVVTLPDDATVAFPVGTVIYFIRSYDALTDYGSFVGGGSAVIHVYGTGLTIGGAYAYFKATKIGANSWHLRGDYTL